VIRQKAELPFIQLAFIALFRQFSFRWSGSCHSADSVTFSQLFRRLSFRWLGSFQLTTKKLPSKW
jgi:hypothetical protein